MLCGAADGFFKQKAKQREHGKLAGCGDGYCPEERERKRSKSEKAGKQQHSAGKQQTHTDAERTAQTVKGHGNIEKIDHEGKAGDYHAGGGENTVCNPESRQELGEIQKTYAGKDAYAAGNTAAEYVFQKIAAHPFAVGFKGKHEGGDSYSRAGQQGHLYGLEGVRTTDEYKQNSQQRSVERFYKKEGGGALEIVYTAAALRNHCGHGGKIVIEKDELGYAAGCGGAVAHGYGAIGCAQGGDIVYTVAHEGHGVTL